MCQKMKQETNQSIYRHIREMVRPDEMKYYIQDGRWTPVRDWLWVEHYKRSTNTKAGRKEMQKFDWLAQLEKDIPVLSIDFFLMVLVFVARRATVQR